MTDTLENLMAMRELLSKKRRWTKRLYAKNIFGYPVKCTSRWARSWCLVGALNKVALEDAKPHVVEREVYLALSRAGCYSAIGFNDSPRTTHEDVLALLDRAIESEKV